METDKKTKADLRFNIDGRIIVFRDVLIAKNDDNFIEFIDIYDAKHKTYAKRFLLSMEVKE